MKREYNNYTPREDDEAPISEIEKEDDGTRATIEQEREDSTTWYELKLYREVAKNNPLLSLEETQELTEAIYNGGRVCYSKAELLILALGGEAINTKMRAIIAAKEGVDPKTIKTSLQDVKGLEDLKSAYPNSALYYSYANRGTFVQAILELAPCLTKADDRKIYEEFIKEDISCQIARTKLIEHNIGLVISRAIHYKQNHPKSSHTISDLVQHGMMGFMRGLETFNPFYYIVKETNQRIKLSSYITYWIDQAIVRAIETTGFIIHRPAHVSLEIKKFVQAEINLIHEEQRDDISPDELSKRLNIAKDKIEVLQKLNQTPISLETNVTQFNKPVPLVDIIEDPKQEHPLKKIENQELVEKLLAVLDDERQKTVIQLRFGLIDGRPRSLGEVGEYLKLSRERIRQLEEEAMLKMRLKGKELDK